MQIGTVDVDKLRGVGDKFVGLYKEFAGVLIDNERLQKAGEAQQEKGTQALKALREETKAEAKDAKAEALSRKNPGSRGSGVVAEVKGKAKQVAGSVIGDSDLQKEGEDDEERGAAGREATQHRAAAKAHEVKAKTAEKAQDAADS